MAQILVEQVLAKVVSITDNELTFDTGHTLSTIHVNHDPMEDIWLAFSELKLEDFSGLVFDITADKFFNRIEKFGIELVSINGGVVKIRGYSCSHYTNFKLKLFKKDVEKRIYDIENCESWFYSKENVARREEHLPSKAFTFILDLKIRKEITITNKSWESASRVIEDFVNTLVTNNPQNCDDILRLNSNDYQLIITRKEVN